MDDYKELLLSIFDRTVKGSILISKKATIEDGFKFSNFTIEFKHLDADDDKTYELLKELFKRIESDLSNKHGTNTR